MGDKGRDEEWDHDRLGRVERDVRELEQRFVSREVLEQRWASIERRFVEVEADVAEMKGVWMWLTRIIIAAVTMAVLGLVLVKP